MEKNEKLINTKVLLTTLKGYEKIMNSEEREKFYKVIKEFSHMEETMVKSEEIIEQKMKALEGLQSEVYKTFDYIVDTFDEFVKKYDEKINNVEKYSINNQQKNDNCNNYHKCGENCKCKETNSEEISDKTKLKNIEELLSEEEMKDFLKILNMLFIGSK